ncbi:MAG TPA: ABC transporter permease [Terriglobales bacterium]|nr:ABC transporter permease [Terriglobales bacterium]
MTGTLQDLRYATRGLRKSPAFMLVAALTLALGIGANIAVFSVMNAILLNPSGIPHPDRVIALRAKYSLADLSNINISAPDFGDAVTGKDVITSAAVLQAANFNYSGNGTTPERLVGARVSWQWFDVFWASPYLGRVFRPEEDQPNANHEVVLAYHTWKQRFGGDPAIAGKSLLLNQESYQVVGVMRADFDWPNGTELWTPIALPSSQYFDRKSRFNESLFGVARLRPGVSVEQANAFLQLRSAQEIAAEGPNAYGQSAGWGMFAMPLIDLVAGNLRKPLAILLAAVATVLLIACANIAGLLLARATGRQHEVSIQIALGAGNWRLIQQALLESLVLAVAGVLLGLIIAHFAIPMLLLLAPASLAGNLTVHMGGPVLVFVSVIGVLCVLFCGTVPAWHATHSRWFPVLQEGGRSGTSGRVRQKLRSVLVVGEIGLAMLLLVSAGLLVRSLAQVERLDTGFEPHGLMTAVFSLPRTYKTDEQQAAFLTAAERELESIPGVKDAALADALPFSANGGLSSFEIEGRVTPPNDPGPHGSIRLISPDYFSTLRIPLLRGRFFAPEDRGKTELVAIIDTTLARQYWPNEDPLGQHINFGDKSPWMTIVGIVAHAKSSSLEADVKEGFYFLPFAQSPNPGGEIVVRTDSAHPENMAGAMQAAIRRVDPNQPLYDLKTMEQRVDGSLVGRRFLVVLLSIFAGLALLLAALGLYGVISYSVRLRTRELGIRVALGAERRDVLRLILGQGVRLAALGLILGLVATFIAGRALSSLLYGVSLFNPLTLLLTSLLLLATVLLASYLPAHWATKVQPMVALRDE